MSESRIEQLWEASQEVLRDCALPNGAMIAANSDLAEYPSTAENYRYVWARDNAFQIVAAETANMPGAADNRAAYLEWLFNDMQDFSETGLIIKRYATNGSLDHRYGQQYQPDQAGALLWALDETRSHPDPRAAIAMRQLANGLVSTWKGNRFARATQDLWENRETSTMRGDSFVYTLAACAHGLQRAVTEWRGRTCETDEWSQAASEMRGLLEADQYAFFRRKVNMPGRGPLDPDNTLDASLDMLVYPFFDETTDQPTWNKRCRTVDAITQQLYEAPDGVERCKGDTYDGIVRVNGREATAGRWPLLTFTHAFALNRTGEADAARDIYDETVAHLDELYEAKVLPDNRIPEQLFSDNREGRGVLPLAWAHAIFILTTRELGLR